MINFPQINFDASFLHHSEGGYDLQERKKIIWQN